MLGPDLGARRRHDQAAELGLLASHTQWGTGDDAHGVHAGRDHQALTGLDIHHRCRH
jgi:hypothetical protein